MLLIKVLFMKKACNVVCHRSLFLCLSGISHGGIVGKFLPKAVGLRKSIKKVGWPYARRGGGGGGGGGSNLQHTIYHLP